MCASFVSALVPALWIALAGCSSSASESPPADATHDTTGDSASDVSAEVATDAGLDGNDGDATCTLKKPYSTKNPACNACAEAHCCAQVNGCLADPRCDDDYVNCILACALLPGDAGDAGVATCLADCASAHPEGKAEYDTAIGCVDAACLDACK